MDEAYRRILANRPGLIRYHSGICECGPCQEVYNRHNATHWCACDPCQTHNEKSKRSLSICERCESMGMTGAMGLIQYRTEPAHGMESLEICPGCVGDFKTWLETDSMTTRERAYKRPWKPEDNAVTADDPGQIIITDKEGLRKMLRELESGEE